MESSDFNFHKLKCYTKGRALVSEIYRFVNDLPTEERFALADQLSRAAVSITSNIAEGSGRQSKKYQAHFIEMSYGSLMEVMSQLDVPVDLTYISHDDYERLEEMIEAQILSGYRNYLMRV